MRTIEIQVGSLIQRWKGGKRTQTEFEKRNDRWVRRKWNEAEACWINQEEVIETVCFQWKVLDKERWNRIKPMSIIRTETWKIEECGDWIHLQAPVDVVMRSRLLERLVAEHVMDATYQEANTEKGRYWFWHRPKWYQWPIQWIQVFRERMWIWRHPRPKCSDAVTFETWMEKSKGTTYPKRKDTARIYS